MTKRMKKPVSFLLAVVMVASMFAAVPFTAGATAYGALVYSDDLQAGDTLVNDCFLENNGYTIFLKGGTYSDDSYSIDGYIPSEDLLIIPGSFSRLEFDDNMPVIYTSDIFTSYIFVDAEGNRSDTIYVLAVDHDHSEITLGGFDPDQAAADTVTGLIDAIGTVEYTAESKALIDAAREAYDALTDVQKARVTNYTDLTDAETAYAALEAAADAAAANAVMDEIDAIGTVEYTAESKALIDAAREAYDALTDAQKALVTNYTDLTDAETSYAALELAAGEYVLTVIVGEKTTRIRGNNEDTVTLPAAEPPTGYTFNGYIKSGYGTLTEEDGVYTFLFDSGDATLTAKLKQNRYYIHFDGNGNISSRPGNMNDKPCYYDRPAKLTKNAFNYTGMDFVGWNTEPDGSGVAYKDQELVKNQITEYDAKITLYAQWTDQRCEVTLVYPDEVDLQNPTYIVESGGTVTPEQFLNAGNADGHYRFASSEQELTGITGDTTIEVQYTFEPHDFGEGMIQIEPTCTERGTIVQACRDCGYLRTTYLPAEHQGLVITEGYAETCTEDGLSDAVDCLVCGENLTEAVEIPASGHYDEDEDGYCDVCGFAINAVDEMSVTIKDTIGVNFLLDLDNYEGVDSVTVKYKDFSGNLVEKTVLKNKMTVEDGKYKLSIDIAPAQLADVISVTVGNTTYTQSVLAYCEELKSGDCEQRYKDVAIALENYAQAANDVFNYSDDTIANIGGLDPTAAQNAQIVFTDGTGMVNGASFMALTKPEFRFYVKDDIDEAAAIAYNQAGVTATMDGGSDTLNARFVKKSDDSILIEVTGVSAENMDKEITVTVTGLGTITFNGNAFAKAMAKSSNPEQQRLGAALYNYGDAAKTCFADDVEKIVDLSTLDGDYEAQNGDVLTGTLAGDYKITIADSAAVTLKNAVITCLTNDACFAGITPLGDATITLEGANVVKNGNYAYPGIYVPENKTLTIDGAGSLDASSDVNDGGTGCGIGGGDHISAGNIVINGGTITANGGNEAAGIGCGPEADSGDIVINSGKVTAYGGHKSAGIGSGVMGNCGDIVINGGTVTATGGYEGVGIGSGACGSCDDITISGGTVTAEAGYGWYCPGIGAGKERATCGNILIKNTVTEVWAVANAENAPVGAGQSSTCGTVRIESGANVNLV